jgi:hypothetical protein
MDAIGEKVSDLSSSNINRNKEGRITNRIENDIFKAHTSKYGL